MGFGLDLGAKLNQVGTKIDQKSKLKKACNKDGDRELLNVKILGRSENIYWMTKASWGPVGSMRG